MSLKKIAFATFHYCSVLRQVIRSAQQKTVAMTDMQQKKNDMITTVFTGRQNPVSTLAPGLRCSERQHSGLQSSHC